MSPLTYRNNWNSDEYYVDDGLVKNLSKVEIDGVLYNVRGMNISVPYNDHGHTYTATSRHYFVTMRVFGIDMEFDLNKIVGKAVVLAVEWEAQ